MRENQLSRLGVRILQTMVLLAATQSSWGALNKCTGADGKVTYTEQVCEQSQTRTNVKIVSAPPVDSEVAGSRRNHDISPGQRALCERARLTLESGKRTVADERYKKQQDVIANARQEIGNLEKLIREQCN